MDPTGRNEPEAKNDDTIDVKGRKTAFTSMFQFAAQQVANSLQSSDRLAS